MNLPHSGFFIPTFSIINCLGLTFSTQEEYLYLSLQQTKRNLKEKQLCLQGRSTAAVCAEKQHHHHIQAKVTESFLLLDGVLPSILESISSPAFIIFHIKQGWLQRLPKEKRQSYIPNLRGSAMRDYHFSFLCSNRVKEKSLKKTHQKTRKQPEVICPAQEVPSVLDQLLWNLGILQPDIFIQTEASW